MTAARHAAAPNVAAQCVDTDAYDDYAVLTGRPPLAEFVRFVKRASLAGVLEDELALTREWQGARENVRRLEVAEAGFADTDDPPPLPRDITSFADAQLDRSPERPHLRFLPYQWAWVELDRLVIYQKSVNLTFIEELKNSLPPHPTTEELVSIASGGMRTLPEVRVAQIDGNTFSFVSRSNDLRILSTTPFEAANVTDARLRGNASTVLGIFVGYGTNLLQAVRTRRRTVLLNGTHRACALRALGITHVPCIVSYAQEEDLDLAGLADLRQNFERHFITPRPILFKDYFDDQVRRRVRVSRHNVMLHVELTIRKSTIPSV